MSIIQAAGSGEVSTGFYKHLLDQSLKFDNTSSTSLTRTAGSPTDGKKATWSWWMKKSDITVDTSISYKSIFYSGSPNSDGFRIGFFRYGDGNYNVPALMVNQDNGSSAAHMFVLTSAIYRDVSGWYHFVVSYDSTDSTAADRIKIYVNGTQQTINTSSSWASANYPSLNHIPSFQVSGKTLRIGGGRTDVNEHIGGYLAEVNFIDGTAYDASNFGETKDGVWVAKDSSGLTFGNNGFHLTFKDDVVSEGFNTVTYTGNGGTQSISGLGFSPALIWIKSRSQARGHVLEDVVRGAGKYLQSNTTGAEGTSSTTTQSFDADGFTQGSNAATNNGSGETYVGWCWEAGGTPTADNSAGAGATPTAGSVKIDGSNLGSALAGTIPATRLTANTSRGFSIISYTGNGGSSQTVAHGLSSAPEFIIHKDRGTNSNNGSWNAYHASVGDDYGYLSSTAAFTGTAQIIPNGTDTIELKSNLVTTNQNNHNFIMYAFHSVTGYSSFGGYSGSGSSGKAVTGLGFRPAWLMIKVSAGATGNWIIWDNTRNVVNTDVQNPLFANLSNAEWSGGSPYQIEFDSDGFTINETSTQVNASGDTYLYVAFADTREAAFFKDVSTNGNNFTPVNLDYRDSVPDTPTNNFATFNPLLFNANVYSEGNLKNASAGNDWEIQVATMFPAGISGKWYAEFYVHTCNASGTRVGVGVTDANVDPEYYLGQASPDVAYYDINDIYTGGSKTADSNLTFAAGDIISVALNLDDGEVTFRKNNSTMTNGTQDLIANTLYTFATTNYGSGAGVIANFGQDSSFSGVKSTANSNADGNGHGSFAYAPPSGFLAICSQNLDSPAITDGTEHFNTVLWTGNGSDGRSITGVGFDPDFVWIKSRNLATSHLLNDTIRGANKSLFSEGTTAETANNGGGYLSAFVTDGFSVTSGGSGDNAVNDGSDTYVSWNWLAGTAFSNSAGANGATIASSGQVNTTAGFSIVKYTGNATAGATVAHGLSSAPEFIITKNRDASTAWHVYYGDATDYLVLNTTAATADSAASGWNDVAPTSSVFSLGASNPSNANQDIAYCFHSVEGYSKVGSYVGNGNANGPFVYTGFRPAWIMWKSTTQAGSGWYIVDTQRNPFNEAKGADLYAQDTATEPASGSGNMIDINSNGFKHRSSRLYINGSGATYIYLAFAEQPFKFSNAR